MSAEASRSYRCRSSNGRWSFDVPEGVCVGVGRDPAWSDVVVPITVLSRRHALFRNEAGVLTVEDQGTWGGTWVNGVRLAEVGRLSPGDRVKLTGFVEFVVEDAVAGE